MHSDHTAFIFFFGYFFIIKTPMNIISIVLISLGSIALALSSLIKTHITFFQAGKRLYYYQIICGLLVALGLVLQTMHLFPDNKTVIAAVSLTIAGILAWFLYDLLSSWGSFLAGDSRKYYYQIACGLMIAVGIVILSLQLF
jgi:hypothetical protein